MANPREVSDKTKLYYAEIVGNGITYVDTLPLNMDFIGSNPNLIELENVIKLLRSAGNMLNASTQNMNSSITLIPVEKCDQIIQRIRLAISQNTIDSESKNSEKNDKSGPCCKLC